MTLMFRYAAARAGTLTLLPVAHAPVEPSVLNVSNGSYVVETLPAPVMAV